MIVIVIWVDDLIIGASNDLLLCETKNMLKDRFKIKDLGKLSHFTLNKVMVMSRSVRKVIYSKYLRDLGCLTVSLAVPLLNPRLTAVGENQSIPKHIVKLLVV